MRHYTIAKGRTPEELAAAVNGLIASGWYPSGSMQVTTFTVQYEDLPELYQNYWEYYQPMWNSGGAA